MISAFWGFLLIGVVAMVPIVWDLRDWITEHRLIRTSAQAPARHPPPRAGAHLSDRKGSGPHPRAAPTLHTSGRSPWDALPNEDHYDVDLERPEPLPDGRDTL